MVNETNDDKVFDKILECVLNGQLTSPKDLKLFVIVDRELQKKVIWDLFEEKITTTKDKKEKHKLINRFSRANLL
jgi:hypothetical protein